jgi:hypothetical protein
MIKECGIGLAGENGNLATYKIFVKKGTNEREVGATPGKQ